MAKNTEKKNPDELTAEEQKKLRDIFNVIVAAEQIEANWDVQNVYETRLRFAWAWQVLGLPMEATKLAKEPLYTADLIKSMWAAAATTAQTKGDLLRALARFPHIANVLEKRVNDYKQTPPDLSQRWKRLSEMFVKGMSAFETGAAPAITQADLRKANKGAQAAQAAQQKEAERQQEIQKLNVQLLRVEPAEQEEIRNKIAALKREAEPVQLSLNFPAAVQQRIETIGVLNFTPDEQHTAQMLYDYIAQQEQGGGVIEKTIEGAHRLLCRVDWGRFCSMCGVENRSENRERLKRDLYNLSQRTAAVIVASRDEFGHPISKLEQPKPFYYTDKATDNITGEVVVQIGINLDWFACVKEIQDRENRTKLQPAYYRCVILPPETPERIKKAAEVLERLLVQKHVRGVPIKGILQEAIWQCMFPLEFRDHRKKEMQELWEQVIEVLTKAGQIAKCVERKKGAWGVTYDITLTGSSLPTPKKGKRGRPKKNPA